MERVHLPSDVELEDRLAFGLSARQLAILVPTALAAYGLFALAGSRLPLPLAAAAAVPVALAGAALALGRRDGLSGDRLLLAAGRHLAMPRRRVLAPQGLPAPLPGAPARPALAPIDLPVRNVLRSGLVELAGGGGFRLLLRARGTSFALRSAEEQAALVEAFARFLNALSEPVAILVRSEPADLGEQVGELERSAPQLPHPALRRAAAAHADFLAGIAEAAQRRETLLVLSSQEQQPGVAQAALERRAAEAAELLRSAAVEVGVLPGEEAAALLARAFDPPGPPAGVSLSGVVSAC
jgi:PrgI family protein